MTSDDIQSLYNLTETYKEWVEDYMDKFEEGEVRYKEIERVFIQIKQLKTSITRMIAQMEDGTTMVFIEEEGIAPWPSQNLDLRTGGDAWYAKETIQRAKETVKIRDEDLGPISPMHYKRKFTWFTFFDRVGERFFGFN